MKKYGFSPDKWSALKNEIRSILIELAKSPHTTITYTGLTEKIVSANFVPNSNTLSELLTEISREEYDAGRWMLSALVVRQDRDMNGFIDVAAQLGRDVSAPEKFWSEEIDRVRDYWQNHKP